MITILFIILAGVSNGIMDTLFTRYRRSIFSNLNPFFWNPEKSWVNKWSRPYIPFKERFLFSSTILVFLTDAWHLFKALMIGFIMLGVVCYKPIFGGVIDFFMLYTIFTGIFTLCYDYILKRI